MNFWTVLRVISLFFLIFMLCTVIFTMFLSGSPLAGHALDPLVVTIASVWWLERRRGNKRSQKKLQSSSNRRKPKAPLKRNLDTPLQPLKNAIPDGEKFDPTTRSRGDQSTQHQYRGLHLDNDRWINESTFNNSATEQKNSWISSTKTATVAGRNIGGLVYVGTPPRLNKYGYGEACKAFIDPSLTVAKTSDDKANADLPYWPSYTELSPPARATYLNWLATGRADSTYNPGFAFLYFYGLERRFFIDTPNTDSNDIIQEVFRLRSLYNDNRSIQRYLSEFIDVAMLSTSELPIFEPTFNLKSWEVSLSTRYVIGTKLAQGEPLEADWLLSWFFSHPEKNLRTPVTRCKEEFIALFKIRFQARFPTGLKVTKPRKKLTVLYRAASGEFEFDFEPTLHDNPVPDISGLRKPIEIAQEITDEVTDDLDKLSRYLGRHPNGRDSIEAHALLPHELWELFPSESLKELKVWARNLVETGGLVRVLDVVEQLEGTRPSKLTKRTLTGAADALARIGFGLAPDPRFALRSPKITESVVVFELGEPVMQLEAVSTQYRTALTELALSSFVVHADGQIHNNEQQALLKTVRNVDGLTSQEQRRLEANLNWMLATPPDLALLKRKVKDASPEAIKSLRIALVTAAHADGVVQPEEVAGIEKVYKAMGLDQTLAYSDLHAGNPMDGPTRVLAAEKGKRGESIPAEEQAGIPKLDASRIASIKSDTERVSSVLGDIFTEISDEPQKDDLQTGALKGLDEKHTILLTTIIERETWTEDEMQTLCNERGLMISGAIETINEWTFENCDEGLIDEYNGYEISTDTANKLKEILAKESL